MGQTLEPATLHSARYHHAGTILNRHAKNERFRTRKPK